MPESAAMYCACSSRSRLAAGRIRTRLFTYGSCDGVRSAPNASCSRRPGPPRLVRRKRVLRAKEPRSFPLFCASDPRGLRNGGIHWECCSNLPAPARRCIPEAFSARRCSETPYSQVNRRSQLMSINGRKWRSRVCQDVNPGFQLLTVQRNG